MSAWSERELAALRTGQEILLAEIWNAVKELEDTRSDTSYGRGQKFILRALLEKLDMKTEVTQ